MSEVVELKQVEELAENMKKHKDAQDILIKKLEQDLIVAQKSAGAYEADKAEITQKFKELNDSYQAIEKSVKSKTLTPKEQASFAELIGNSVTANWAEIEKFKNARKNFTARFEIVDTKAVADMGINVSVTDPGAYFTTVLPGIRTLPNRKVHMREIIPLGTMSNSSVTFMREVGGEGDLAPALENGDKSQLDRDFIEVTVPAEYIAGWLRVSRKMLDDMVAFRSYLQMRLMEMYLKAEDNQTLNGNGTSPQLVGILSIAVANLQTTGPNIERLVRGIAQLESGDYSATGIAMTPAAYYDIALNKASGSGEYDLPGIVVIQNGQLYVAGVPVYKTTAFTDLTQYIIGDWATGAMLFIREQPVVEYFDQDSNNVTTNKITVRIEGRVALAIFRAEAFVKGNFTFTT